MASRSNIIKKLSNKKAIYFKKSKKKKFLRIHRECSSSSNKKKNRCSSLSAFADNRNTFDIQQTYDWILNENQEPASREITGNSELNVKSQISIPDSQKDFTCSNNNEMRSQNYYGTYDGPFRSCDCCSNNAPLPVINDFEINDDLIRCAVAASNTSLRIQNYFQPPPQYCASTTNLPVYPSASLMNFSCKCKYNSALNVGHYCSPVTNFNPDESQSDDECCSSNPSRSSSCFYNNEELCQLFEQFRKFSMSPTHRETCKMRRKSRSTTDQAYRSSFRDQNPPYDSNREMFSMKTFNTHLGHGRSSPFISSIEKMSKTNGKPEKRDKHLDKSLSNLSAVDISEGRFKIYPIQKSVFTQSPSISDHSDIGQSQGKFLSGANFSSQIMETQRKESKASKLKIIGPYTENKHSFPREVVDNSAEVTLPESYEERNVWPATDDVISLSNVSSENAIHVEINRSSNVHNSSPGANPGYERRHSKSSLKKEHTMSSSDRKKKRIKFVDILLRGDQPADNSTISKESKWTPEENTAVMSPRFVVRRVPSEMSLKDFEHKPVEDEPADRKRLFNEDDDEDNLSTISGSSFSNLSNSSNRNNEKTYGNSQRLNSNSAVPISPNVSSKLLKYHIKCLLNSWSSITKRKKKSKLSKSDHPIGSKLATKAMEDKSRRVFTLKKIPTKGDAKTKTSDCESRNSKSSILAYRQPTEAKQASLSRRLMRTVFSPIKSKPKNYITSVYNSGSRHGEIIPKHDPEKYRKNPPQKCMHKPIDNKLRHVENSDMNRSLSLYLDNLDPSSPIGKLLTSLSDQLTKKKETRKIIDSTPRRSRKTSSPLRTKIFKAYHSGSNQSQNNSHESVESYQTQHKRKENKFQNSSEIKIPREKAGRKFAASLTNHEPRIPGKHREELDYTEKPSNCEENLRMFYNFMYSYYRNKVFQYNDVVADESSTVENSKFTPGNSQRADDRTRCDEVKKHKTIIFNSQHTVPSGVVESPKNNHSNIRLGESENLKNGDRVKENLIDNSFQKASSTVRPRTFNSCLNSNKDVIIDSVNRKTDSADGVEGAVARSVADRIKSLALEELKAYFQNPKSEWNRHFNEYTKEATHFLNIFKDSHHHVGKHSLEGDKNSGCTLKCNQNRECSLEHNKNTCAWTNAASGQKNSAKLSQDGHPLNEFPETVKPLGRFLSLHHEHLSAWSHSQSNKPHSDQLQSVEFNNHATAPPALLQVPMKGGRPSICPDRIYDLDKAYEAQRRRFSPEMNPTSVGQAMPLVNQLISINQPAMPVSNVCPSRHEQVKMKMNRLLDQRHRADVGGFRNVTCPHKNCTSCRSETYHSHATFPTAVARPPQIVFPRQVFNQNASNMEDCMSWLAKDFYPIQKLYNP